MEIIDVSKVLCRNNKREKHKKRRINDTGSGILAKIATLQHAADARLKAGETGDYALLRRELCDLIFTVISDDNAIK